MTDVDLRDALNSQHYKIDYYQRNYEWGEKEAQDLIEDLIVKFKESYNKDHAVKEVLNYKQYFLGSFVLSVKKNDNYIIDGQQRLTTLSLVFLCLFKKSQELNIENIKDSENYVYSRVLGEKHYNINVENRLPIMDYILNDYPNSDSDLYASNKIFINYKIIEKTLDHDKRFLEMFYYWLTHRVAMVKIETSNDNEAYTIFEAMNDRGKTLSKLELIKGYLLSLVDEEHRPKCVNIWKKMEERFDYDKQGDKKFNQFIVEFFRSKWALTAPQQASRDPKLGTSDWTRIGTNFHRWFKEKRQEPHIDIKTSEDVVLLFEKLEYFSKVYLRILNLKENMAEGFEDLCYLHYQNVAHINTLIMGVIDFNDDDADLKIKIVSKAMSIRFAYYTWSELALDERNMGDFIISLLKNIRKDPITQDTDGLLWFLCNELRAKIDRKLRKFDSETVPKLKARRNSKKAIFGLLSVMTYFIEKKGKSNISFESISETSNIEHVLAANHEVNKDQFDSQEELEFVRNEIGALGILTKEINSSLNDSPYAVKVQKYPQHNKLLGTLSKDLYSSSSGRVFENQPGLNSFLQENPQLKELFKPYEAFNKQSIAERNELYAELCKIIWNVDDLLHYCSFDEIKTFDDLDEYIDGDFDYIDESDDDAFAVKGKERARIKNPNPYVLEDSLGNHIESPVIKRLYTEWVKELVKNDEYKQKFIDERDQTGKIFKDSAHDTTYKYAYLSDGLYLANNLSTKDTKKRIEKIASMLNIKINSLERKELQ